MVIDEIKLPIYGLLIVLSIIIGTIYTCINLKREKLKNEYILYFAILNITLILFGSLIISNIFKISLSSYFGVMFAIIGSLVFNFIVPKNNIYLKYSIISLPLVYSIGKIGCFFAGCCYGIPYNHILSVTYTNGLNIPLFPIQLLESVVFLIIFIILNKYKKNKNIIHISLIICAISKLLLDFLRYDHVNKLITANQIISIALIIIVLIYKFFVNKKID